MVRLYFSFFTLIVLFTVTGCHGISPVQPKKYTQEYRHQGKTNLGTYDLRTRTRYDKRRGTTQQYEIRLKGKGGQMYRYVVEY